MRKDGRGSDGCLEGRIEGWWREVEKVDEGAHPVVAGQPVLDLVRTNHQEAQGVGFLAGVGLEREDEKSGQGFSRIENASNVLHVEVEVDRIDVVEMIVQKD